MKHRTHLLTSALVLSGACVESSPREEDVGVATSAIVSSEFSIACESAMVPGVAVNGTTALAAWAAADGTVHAARFDADGNVLDPSPIALGLPPPPTSYPITLEQTGLGVVRTATGFAVVGAFYSYYGAGQHDELLEWREVDLSGVPVGPWQLLYTYSHSTGATLPYLQILQSGFDGTTSYVSIDQHTHLSPAYSRSWYRVFALGGGQVLDVPPVQSGVEWYQAQWAGFGCGATGCMAQWLEPLTSVPKAQVIGQPAVTLATVQGGVVVGTPIGFLQVAGNATGFSPAGVPVAGPTPVTGASMYFLQGAFDGSETRVVWSDFTNLYSATVANDTSIVTPPVQEIPGWSSDFAVASFGGERSVVVHGSATGVTARFIGALPAAVPPSCSSGSGGGGAAAGGAPPGGGAPSSGGASPAGGAPPIGGSPSPGGAPATGGSPPSGGAPSIGGSPSTAGAQPVGGSPSAGGEAPAGAAPATGGEASIGGQSANGGAPSMAGAPANGGASAAGGSGPPANGGSSGEVDEGGCSATGPGGAAPSTGAALALALGLAATRRRHAPAKRDADK